MRAQAGAGHSVHREQHFAPARPLGPPDQAPTGPSTAVQREQRPPRRPPRPSAPARILGWLGRGAITAGVLVLLFVVYQLWGTGLATARSQGRLEDDFEARVQEAEAPTAPDVPLATGPSPATPTAPAAGVVPDEGEAGGRIEIPDIGVDWIFVEGVGVGDLQQGPGHFPGTPFPGQAGNASLAGHRTTYGAPFNRIDELESGDEIVVTTVQGRFRYVVADQRIVRPDQVEVLEDFGDDRLTLIACHPKYSARQRIVVAAELAGAPAPAPTAPRADSDRGAARPPVALDAGLGSDSASTLPVVLSGLVPACIWLAAWLAGRLWRKWPAYLAGLPLFLVTLFVFYENLGRLLPANF